jgi:hypothetical protein
MQYGIAPSDQLALRSLLSVALSSVAGKGSLPLYDLDFNTSLAISGRQL